MTARILVVDDSGESVKLLQRKLTSEYLEVITAQDGAEALARIAEMALQIAERLRQTIADEPFAISTEKENESLLSVTISIGIATTCGLDDTAEALLKRADLALYRAKRGGRNRAVVDA